jgi:hypothetical protein
MDPGHENRPEPGADIDPATVTSLRAGNSLGPGLAAFTGVTFFVYLLIKLAAGTVPFDMGFVVQIVVAAALMGVGCGLLYRARYFYVAVETPDGRRRIAGLSKAQQQALVARLSSQGADGAR